MTAQPHLRGLLFVAIFVALALGCRRKASPVPQSGPTSSAYPVARQGDAVDTFHGVQVADPYRWMEDLGSVEVKRWLEAETTLTRRWMESVTTRERIAQQLAKAFDYPRVFPPRKRAGRYFFAENSGLQDQPVLYVTEGPAGEPRPLVDFNQISPDGKLAFAGFSVSRGGALVAYGLSAGGSDWTEWRVRDVKTGRDLPDRVEWTKYYAPAFTADEKAFYYSNFPAPPAGQEVTAKDLGCRVRLHRLGTESSADPVIYERADHPTWQFDVAVTDDGRYLVITVGDGQVGDRGLEEIQVLDLEAKDAKPVALVAGFDAEYVYATSEGSTFFLKTNSGAPNGRVIAVDARNPRREAWKTIVPSGDAVVREVERAGDRLIVAALVDASSRLFLYRLDGSQRMEIALPGMGTAYPLPTEKADDEALYVYTSFDMPPTTFRYAPRAGTSEAFRPAKPGLDTSNLEASQVFYKSKDDTRVPMFLVHKKGIALDGQNPTYLTGYGGFGVTIGPGYEPTHAWWLSIGGVLAIPCLRGGGEYGVAWQRAAEKTHKQVTFDDFIAAAEFLIADKITSTPKLAIAGASNGGLLVGAAVTQRPDLFGAVVVQVGVLDMLRFHLAGQGEGWQGAYGSPDVPEQFRALLAYSPLHNVKAGTRYPPILVVTGENDSRVAPWHSYKFVAALQQAQAGPAPILLDLESTAGHGGGIRLSAKLKSRADAYGFILKVLDVSLP